jgi:hypothetical protein
MKKTLFALISLAFASLSFAAGETTPAPAKCDSKDAKACCCCCCCKAAKACSTDKAACPDKKDAKPAEAPAMK